MVEQGMPALTRSAGRALRYCRRSPGVHGAVIQEERVEGRSATHRAGIAATALDWAVQQPVAEAVVVACAVLRSAATVGCATFRWFVRPPCTGHRHSHQGLARSDAWR